MRKICVYALTGLLTVGSITSGGIHNASARGKDAEAAVCVENKEDKKEAKKRQKKDEKAAKQAEKEQQKAEKKAEKAEEKAEKKAEKNATKEEKKADKQAEKDEKHGNESEVLQENPQWYETAKAIYEERYNPNLMSAEYYCEGIADPMSFYAAYDELFGSDCFGVSIGTYRTKLISISMDPKEQVCGVIIDFSYSDGTRYAVNGIVSLNDLENAIRNLDTVDWDDSLDKSALGLHNLQGDAELLIARLLYMFDGAMEGTGFSLNDAGIVFSEDYSNVDVFRCFSDDKPIVNEHCFENGVCADCGLTWMEYVYAAASQINGNDDYSQFLYGTYGPYYVHGGDYVAITSDPFSLQLYYHGSSEAGSSYSCEVMFYEDCVNLTYAMLDEFTYIGDGVFAPASYICFGFVCDKKDFANIARSKEALMDAASYVLILDDVYYSEEDAAFLEECENVQTKSDLIDSFMAEYDSYMNSMDYALSIVNTNLSESGLDY